MKGKRIVNVRILFVAFVGLTLGILFGYNVLKSVYMHTFQYVLIPIILLLVALCVLIVLRLIKSDNAIINKINTYFKSTIACVLLFAIGCVSVVLRLNYYLHLHSYDTECQIECVADNVYVYDEYVNVVTKRFSVNGQTVNQSATITVFLSDSTSNSVGVGSKLTFSGKAVLTPLFDKTSNLSKYLNGKAYSIQANYEDITLGSAKVSFDTGIRRYVYNVLSTNISEDNAGIAYSMLFGGREHLAGSISEMFSYAGISHVLAVSGLHVGLLIGAFMWILKRLKVKRWTNLICCTVLLAVYCYICGFAPSVVRASIMSVIMMLAYVLGKEYDVLSSLSLAGIITLVVNPFNLFDIGFQLSYLCILCIITLSNTIARALKAIKLPKVVCSTLAISICINLTIMPISANAFNTVSVVGALANVIVLPLFGITFPVLLICTLLASIMPFMGFVLHLPNILLHAIKVIANFFANLNIINLKLFNISAIVITCLILILLVVKYLMVHKKLKLAVIGCLVVVSSITFGLGMASEHYTNTLALSYQYKSNSAVITIDGHNVLVGTSNKYIGSMLKQLKIRKIDYIIGYDMQLNGVDELSGQCVNYGVKCVYLPTDIASSAVSSIKCSTVFSDSFNLGNCHFEFAYDSADNCIGLYINGHTKVLFASTNNTSAQNTQLINNYYNADCLITNTINVNASLLEDIGTVYTYNESTHDNIKNLYEYDKYLLGV